MKLRSPEINVLTGLGADLLETVLELYKNDIAELKARNSEFQHDHLVALEVHLEEVEAGLTYAKDRRLAVSQTNAGLKDTNAIDTILQAERQDAEDRRFALIVARRDGQEAPLNDIHNPANLPLEQPSSSVKKSAELSRLASQWVSEDAAVAMLPDSMQGIQAVCTVCRDSKPLFDFAEDFPCGHQYCMDCFKELFDLSMKDEGLFPPRCCTMPIKIGTMVRLLPGELVKQYDEKLVESTTLNKTYCANKVCSKFIRSDAIKGNIGHCKECGTDTCEFCKSEAHVGSICQEDTEAQAVRELARENNWQQCGSCRSLVQLSVGCNHMTCRCGHQFCYVCARTWKTCRCDQWDEGNLLERAEVVAEREDRDAREIREELIENHLCSHPGWQSRGGGTCDDCGHEMKEYLFWCRRCHLALCRRCRFNRVR